MRTQILAVGAAALFAINPSLHAGTFSVLPWTGDGDSGLSNLTNYTAVVDFAGDGTRSINGVNFTNTGIIGTGTSSYQLLNVPATFTGFTANLTGSSNLIASDFLHSGGTGGGNLTIGNLVPGQNYTTTWYTAGFGPVGGRFVTITPGDGSAPFTYDANVSGPGNGHRLTYNFTAVARQITFAFDAASDNDSFHHYALTNAGPSGTTGALTLVTPTYDAQSQAGGPFAPYTVLNNDLLQTSLAGAVVNSGDFTLEGTGGVGVLTNGQFSITGIGGNNPQLATGQNGASVSFTLNLTNAPLGFDISQIVGYGGWNDNGRDRQLYNLFYSVVGDSGFTLLGGADFNPGIGGGLVSAVRSTFNTSLTGVDALRIDFLAGQENGHAGYGEFDVVGTATVPEPGAAALLALGVIALGARRRVGAR